MDHQNIDIDTDNDHDAMVVVTAEKDLGFTTPEIPLNPYTVDEDSDLNPASDSFNPEKCVKTMLQLVSKEECPVRVAGVAFKRLNVSGSSTITNTQATVSSIVWRFFDHIRSSINKRNHRVHILHNLEGLIRPGELLVVLGRPGSGCSTFLKTICGETHGITLDPNSEFNYHGIPFKDMHSQFQGEVVYTAEQDVHFPQLSVGVTLEFAALARTPRQPPGNIDRRAWAKHIRDVYMAIFGISHTVNTKVGNEYVRGVSGGERKRVSIAEAALGGSPFQCWDNSTRGLDSVNAIEFCKTLRMTSRLVGMTEAVAIYQAPQTAYNQFDKVQVLYQGRQIFFGPAARARPYFVRLGFHSPERQTTPDFLTSMTSPTERRSGHNFSKRSMNTTMIIHSGGPDFENFRKSIRLQKANFQSSKSPFIMSYAQQIRLCLWRGFERVRADPELQITQIVGQALAMLIISSLYFQLKPDTGAFFSRGSLIFFATLTNAFSSQLEMMSLYDQRPIVEKHARYALYRPSAEALASMLTGLPFKFLNSILFNIILYFMTGLRLTSGAFFFFFLVSFLTMLVMSSMFRTVASVSRTLGEAIAPATIATIGLVIYSGFPMPTEYMHGWARWINWVDPIAYGFEALMINEFHGRNFDCSTFIPTGPGYSQNSSSRVCSAVGSVAGQTWVSGDAYLESSFQYSHSHKWRNIGVLIAFWFMFTAMYLAATDFISAKKSKGEVLVFPRRKIPQHLRLATNDVESGQGKSENEGITSQRLSENPPGDLEVGIVRQTATFQWQDVSYEIEISGKPRLILDRVDGWVRPGTLTVPTALMGVSGAGKTTLLDVLASRVTMGVIYGTVLVNGKQRDDSFQRKTGYAQQQDLHLETSTVREALNFSALLRQPDRYSRSEKLAYVDQVIQLLEMEDIADAVVGVPGEGLNVEQRKRLTIGVELAAKPELLLFLDEPTSGLDSQTSWGGRTVYFGPVGPSASTLLEYFERNGGYQCTGDANPAEYMLEVIGAAPGSHTDIDWPEVWRQSPERTAVKAQLEEWKDVLPNQEPPLILQGNSSYTEFATSLSLQLLQTLIRIFQQYWRTPGYIYAKISLVGGSGIFIGFSFYNEANSQRGLQNQMFSLFMLMVNFGMLAQQVMPHRNALGTTKLRDPFFCWYYPVGLYQNAEPTESVHLRGAQAFLLIMEFLAFSSTFAHFAISAIPNAETAGNIANMCFNMSLLFCGVLAGPTVFPHFWIWMYRISPFNYLVSGLLATSVSDTKVTCSNVEFLNFEPAAKMTCGEYMADFIQNAGGYVEIPSATSACSFCPMSNTNAFLQAVSVEPHQVWRDFGILFAYIVFNICAAILLYWLFRVRSKVKKSSEVVSQPATHEISQAVKSLESHVS
ncbi:hypothetical protein N7481_011682 [Penicillium waksmanii]|uniref:uncharacterized protein n=1 Tax=Penicillium waksmanii TaxID=69791 RepID=UPI002548070F|nr:uncharacterized protein N7481_011682 [Penicillium waksmanii]KAJ5974472.1 hypothetical protein N7481_011682 [Penicillium waksmanii]